MDQMVLEARQEEFQLVDPLREVLLEEFQLVDLQQVEFQLEAHQLEVLMELEELEAWTQAFQTVM